MKIKIFVFSLKKTWGKRNQIDAKQSETKQNVKQNKVKQAKQNACKNIKSVGTKFCFVLLCSVFLFSYKTGTQSIHSLIIYEAKFIPIDGYFSSIIFNTSKMQQNSRNLLHFPLVIMLYQSPIF